MRLVLRFVFSAVVVTALCPAAAAAVKTERPHFLAGQAVGTIESGLIKEASGIAASRNNADVLWVHNDHGDSARLFAMNSRGKHLGIYYLGGVRAADWEDIAIGPGPVDGVDYLYIGDIGDNGASRSNIKVYRVVEPEVDSQQPPVNVTLADVATITLRYPDRPRDAETLMVDPVTKDIYIISKREKHSRLYRAAYPQSTTKITTMEYKCRLPWPRANSGDISPDGSMVIVRSYFNASLWLRPAGINLWEAFSGPAYDMPLIFEPQGEAICFDDKGDGYFTVSEKKHQPIYYFARDKSEKRKAKNAKP